MRWRFWWLMMMMMLMAAPPLAWAEEVVENSVGMRLRLVGGGRYVRGSDGGENTLADAFPLHVNAQYFGNAESPAHLCWITKPFYLAEREVTVSQFRAFVEATGHVTSAEQGATEMVGWAPTPVEKPLYQSHDFERQARFSWREPGFAQGDDHPVVGVSWADAKDYLEWLSGKEGKAYRLPTEAEWELSCRAGTKSWFSFGDVPESLIHRYANVGNAELEKHRQNAAERQWLQDWDNVPEDGHVFTAPVGSYAANAFGFRDLHGNVWEWCEDLWLDTAYNPWKRPRYDAPGGMAVDPVNRTEAQTPTNEFRVIRGGCWYNGPVVCRSALRTFWDAEDAACYVGFRVARDAEDGGSVREAYEREMEVRRMVEKAGGRIYSPDGLALDVRFEGEGQDERVLAALSELPGLERLTLGWRDRDKVLSQAGLESISRLEGLTHLRFGSGFDAGALDLSALGRLGKLRSLTFPRSGPLDDAALGELAGLTTLEFFDCHGTGRVLSDAGLEKLAGNRGLVELRAYETEATGTFLRALAAAGCPLEVFATSAPFQGTGKFTDEAVEVLAGFEGLRMVRLVGQPLLTGKSLEALAAGPGNGLRELVLSGCEGVLDADFAVLARMKRLDRLELGGTNMRAGDGAAEAIGQLPRIRGLVLEGDGLTDAGMEALAGAFSLEDVRLASATVTDDGVRWLGRIHRLRMLKLRFPGIDGSGLGPVAALPYLQDLELGCPGLTDVVFAHFARARQVRKLRLAVRGVRPPQALTDAGMMEMAGARWLTELWLPRNGTGMTEAAMEYLQEQLGKKKAVIPYTVEW